MGERDVVPVSKAVEWNDWNDQDTDDPAAWKSPDWATPIGGHPSGISFENWESFDASAVDDEDDAESAYWKPSNWNPFAKL